MYKPKKMNIYIVSNTTQLFIQIVKKKQLNNRN